MKKMMRVAIVVLALAAAGSVWADGWFGLWSKKEAAAPAPQVAEVVKAEPAADPASQTVGNPLEILPTDRVQGSMTAPVTMIEYASMTCSHCADFANETMPFVKKDWVATGKVKYVFRDLPWDNLALGMSKVARCAPANAFEPLVTALFANQKTIVLGGDPVVEIKKVASTFGMDGAKVDACIKDADLHKQVTDSKDIAMNKLGIRGTPAIFVNGTKVEGAEPYKDFRKVLEAEYAKATSGK